MACQPKFSHRVTNLQLIIVLLSTVDSLDQNKKSSYLENVTPMSVCPLISMMRSFSRSLPSLNTLPPSSTPCTSSPSSLLKQNQTPHWRLLTNLQSKQVQSNQNQTAFLSNGHNIIVESWRPFDTHTSIL